MKLTPKKKLKPGKTVKTVKTKAADAGMKELKKFLAQSREADDGFIRWQAGKTQEFLAQLEAKKITKRQFTQYMQDIRRMAELDALKCSIWKKARLQDFADSLSRLVMQAVMAAM